MSGLDLRCGHMYYDGGKNTRACWMPAEDHVHTPPPCENGQDIRHHDFTVTPEIARARYAPLLSDLAVLAPALSRRQRVALRKALLPA